MQLLTPIVTRINHEFLGKIIEVVYSYYERNNGFASVPPEYDGIDLEVKYVSAAGSGTENEWHGSV